MPLPETLPQKPSSDAGARFFRHAFVPFVLVLATAPWLLRDILGRTSEGAAAVNSMPVMLVLMIVVVWLAEQVYPKNPSWNEHFVADGVQAWSRLGRDLVYLFGVSIVGVFLIQQLAELMGSSLEAFGFGFEGARGVWPHQAPEPLRILAAFFLVEFCSYWHHRAAHHFDFLWRFHSTHHVILELTGLKAWRTHPIENACFYVSRTIPLMLLGVSVDEVVTVTCLGGIFSILAHANVKIYNPVLGLLVNLPYYHEVHHSSAVTEHRSNFGCHTVLWDRVFGTFRSTPIVPLELGVPPVGRRTLWQELAWPLYHSMNTPVSVSAEKN